MAGYFDNPVSTEKMQCHSSRRLRFDFSNQRAGLRPRTVIGARHRGSGFGFSPSSTPSVSYRPANVSNSFTYH
jgi:hypothetical protein